MRTLASVLKANGISGPTHLKKLLDCTYDHAKKVWSGRDALSKNAALAIKKFTDGALTTDYLFSLDKRRRG